MTKVIELFCGAGGLRTAFVDTYRPKLHELVYEIVEKCFEELAEYELADTYQPDDTEYSDARHLADIDVLDMFNLAFVRNHRNYKYSRGRAETARHTVEVMNEHGIFISVDTYNSWRRSSRRRLIPNDCLCKLLDLLHLTLDNFRRLIFAHIAARREIQKQAAESGILVFADAQLRYIWTVVSALQFPRPPCLLPT